MLIAELRIDLAHNPRKHPSFYLIVVIASVDEGAELPAVPVQIDEVLDLVSFEDEVADHFLDGSYHWVEELVRASRPFPVCVGASDVAAGVAVDDSIDVGHWY